MPETLGTNLKRLVYVALDKRLFRLSYIGLKTPTVPCISGCVEWQGPASPPFCILSHSIVKSGEYLGRHISSIGPIKHRVDPTIYLAQSLGIYHLVTQLRSKRYKTSSGVTQVFEQQPLQADSLISSSLSHRTPPLFNIQL